MHSNPLFFTHLGGGWLISLKEGHAFFKNLGAYTLKKLELVLQG